MKKLTYSALIACTFAFFLGSCDKEEATPAARIQASAPEIPSVVIPGSNPELSLTAYSSLPKSTSYTISIDGQPTEEFKVETTAKKKWQLGSLRAGTYTVRIYAGYLDYEDASKFCVFHFNVFDGSKIHSVNCRKLDDRNYGFDLIVKD